MATTNLKITLSGLARKLVNDGLLSEEEALKATEASQKDKVPFVTYVVSKQKIAAKDLAMAASLEFGVPVFDLDAPSW